MKKDIIVLGASGSIGKQSLSLLRYDKNYNLVGICLNKNIDVIEDELLYFENLKTVAIADYKKAQIFKEEHPFYNVIEGDDAAIKLINSFPNAVVLNALMGNVGLLPTLEAIKNNQILLLSNKESLVIGSSLIKEKMKSSTSKIYPIDSEHVGLAKLLNHLKEENISKANIDKLLVTASGGALREYPLDKIPHVSKDIVLHHPTWKMSPKITIDSATLVNKAYEVIEASVLFDFPLDKVSAIICKESLIHAEVIYSLNDERKTICEFSPCDMKVAINYALSLGEEKMHKIWDGDLKKFNSLHIYDIDNKRYPLFEFALSIYRDYSNLGMLFFNDLDSRLIEAYLDDEIEFIDIEKGLKLLPNYLNKNDVLKIDKIKEIEDEARKISCVIIDSLKRR